jgi:hypothetical protein
MYKVLGLALAIIALTASACPGNDGTQTLKLAGGATFALKDSVTHGGGDLKAAKQADTVFVAAAPVLTGPAASSGSSSSASGADACKINIEHDPAQSPAVYTVVVTCQRP